MTQSPVDRLTDMLGNAGCEPVEPPILHDADLFLDLAGEELRRRMYLTANAEGVELCLRPDYTIPVALHHITGGDPSRLANYSYVGSVFRQRPGETGEFQQAGVESIGRDDIVDADAEILALALKSVSIFDVGEPTVRLGDSSLFDALLDALPVADVWRRRLGRAFGDNDLLRSQLDELAGRTTRSRGASAPVGNGDEESVVAAVEELMAAGGLPPTAGRTAGEIAERYLEEAAAEVGTSEDADAVRLIERYIAISGPPDEAALKMGQLAAEELPALSIAIERFTRRTRALIEHDIDTDGITFAADFGRRLDYYTGFVFELADPTARDAKPIAGGGRYDRLVSLIRSRDGTGPDIPAVGFSLWLDRLERFD